MHSKNSAYSNKSKKGWDGRMIVIFIHHSFFGLNQKDAREPSETSEKVVTFEKSSLYGGGNKCLSVSQTLVIDAILVALKGGKVVEVC
jgi:hypothetical protein